MAGPGAEVSDLAAMEPCPTGKRGRHELCAVIPENADQDLTLFCSLCGAIRRRPVTGSLSPALDDLTADEILALVR